RTDSADYHEPHHQRRGSYGANSRNNHSSYESYSDREKRCPVLEIYRYSSCTRNIRFVTGDRYRTRNETRSSISHLRPILHHEVHRTGTWARGCSGHYSSS